MWLSNRLGQCSDQNVSRDFLIYLLFLQQVKHGHGEIPEESADARGASSLLFERLVFLERQSHRGVFESTSITCGLDLAFLQVAEHLKVIEILHERAVAFVAAVV